MAKSTHGPKLNRDWVGLKVKLNRTAQNGFAKLAEGTTGIVDTYSRMGITFLADKCEHCGVQVSISRMERRDFVILTPPEKWPDTRGNPPPRRRW
jgi:hypothetical protein